MGNPIHQVKRALEKVPNKHKPILIKVEPKMTMINKTNSQQIFDAELLSKGEDVDIGDELIPEYHSPDGKRVSEPIAISDTSDTKAHMSKSDFSGSEIACKHNNSGEKHEDDTNISGQKHSMSSSGKPPKYE